jgi:hypothetical protein
MQWGGAVALYLKRVFRVFEGWNLGVMVVCGRRVRASSQKAGRAFFSLITLCPVIARFSGICFDKVKFRMIV